MDPRSNENTQAAQPNRATRRMMKFKPAMYEDKVLEADPAAKRINARRWMFAYSPRLQRMAKGEKS